MLIKMINVRFLEIPDKPLGKSFKDQQAGWDHDADLEINQVRETILTEKYISAFVKIKIDNTPPMYLVYCFSQFLKKSIGKLMAFIEAGPFDISVVEPCTLIATEDLWNPLDVF